IPISQSQGRGIGLASALVYNSSIWTQAYGAWTPVLDPNGNPTWGWQVSGLRNGVSFLTTYEPTCGAILYSGYTYTDGLGTVHPFRIAFWSSSNSCGSDTSGATVALDNSGLYLSATATSSSLTFRSGSKQSGSALYDANGNYVSSTVVSSSETDWIDSIGRT